MFRDKSAFFLHFFFVHSRVLGVRSSIFAVALTDRKRYIRCHRPIHIGFSTHGKPCVATATDGHNSLWIKRNTSGS